MCVCLSVCSPTSVYVDDQFTSVVFPHLSASIEKKTKPTRRLVIGLLSSVDDSGSGRVRQSLQWQYEK